MPDEEEMEAMFNMMFAEMMGFGGGFGGGGQGHRGQGIFDIPVEMFDMMEAMMADEMGDEYDDDDDDDGDENDMEKMMGIFSMMKEAADEDDYDSDDYDEDDLAAAFGLQQADLGSLLMGELLAAERRHAGGKVFGSSGKSMTGSFAALESVTPYYKLWCNCH